VQIWLSFLWIVTYFSKKEKKNVKFFHVFRVFL